jgi:hypothetical protein
VNTSISSKKYKKEYNLEKKHLKKPGKDFKEMKRIIFKMESTFIIIDSLH